MQLVLFIYPAISFSDDTYASSFNASALFLRPPIPPAADQWRFFKLARFDFVHLKHVKQSILIEDDCITYNLLLIVDIKGGKTVLLTC